jgi:hypothetical protein
MCPSAPSAPRHIGAFYTITDRQRFPMEGTMPDPGCMVSKFYLKI